MIYKFDNGYGASIIDDGYGAKDGLLEVAVMERIGGFYELCYDTQITSDVIGNLTHVEALELALEISKLPKR